MATAHSSKMPQGHANSHVNGGAIGHTYMNGHANDHAICHASGHTSVLISSPLTARLLQARTAYTQANPQSHALARQTAAFFPGGSTRASLQTTPFTLTFASGTGATLTDADGHTYADFLGEYTAGLFGHSHPTIRAAITEALANGWNLGGHSRYEAQLAQAVCARFAPTLERVRFTNSGTEANTFAVGTALAWLQGRTPERKTVLVFEGGYHGGTLKFPIGAHQADPLNLPHHFVVAPYDDMAGTAAKLAAVTDTLAAVLVEPMQGNSGARPCRPEFLQFLRAECSRLDAILIFDEVQTSRLGPRGLGAAMGVQPDLMTLGKWVAGGMTFGAFGGRADLMEQYGPAGKLGHAGTFNNNVVSMAAGVVGLAIATPEALAELNARGERLRLELAQVLQMNTPAEKGKGNGILAESVTSNDQPSPAHATYAHSSNGAPVFVSVSGTGSILSFNFAGPDADTHKALFWHAMLDAGIYLSPRGFVALSLAVTDAQCAQFVAAVGVWAAETWEKES